ncbi:hypothetical protein L1885_04285, partial [Streptomyces fuscigenes]|nr:hypothetical protein [Streptomyces fuscigenes]
QGPGAQESARGPQGRPGPRAGGPQQQGPQDPAATGQFARQDLNASGPAYDTRGGYAPQQQGYDANGQAGGDAYAGGRQGPHDTGQYPAQGPAQASYDTGQYPAYDTGQNQAYGYNGAPAGYDARQDQHQQQGYAGQQAGGQQQGPQGAMQQGYAGRQGYQQQGPQGGVPQQPQARGPQHQEALPPAPSPGDGRTPLYDTLETNWFRGAGQNGDNAAAANGSPQGLQGQGGGAPQHAGYGGEQRHEQQQADGPRPAMPRRDPGSGLRGGPAPASDPLFGPSPTGGDGSGVPATGPAANSAWRASPNDELVRQAERVRKPAAGGITTSGLPRRVPRANLVPGTAQEQSTQTGPQVSRAPADVRGRLTNLRRGIQQGRSAGAGGTNGGGFDFGPSHQQERQ